MKKHSQLKAQGKKHSQGKSLLSKKELASGSEESAAVHFIQKDLLGFGDDSKMSDDDPAVVRTVETLTVFEGDGSTLVQEKEVRSVGGMLFQ